MCKSFSMASSPDWAWLPKDILYSTVEKLDLLSDHVHFSTVCKQWRSVAMDSILHPPNKLPLLLIPTKDNSPEKRSLYSLTSHKIFKFQLPVPYNRRLCGSSHGWLATVDKFTAITLLNPVTRSNISLPMLDKDWYSEEEEDDRDYNDYEDYVRKVVLKDEPSVNPDGSFDYEVIAIHGSHGSLAIIRTGDEDWTHIDNNRVVISDVIYFNGQVYGACHQNGLVSIDVISISSVYSDTNSGRRPKANIIVQRRASISPSPATTYLVESTTGDLLFVQRWMVEKDHDLQRVTSEFKAFKLVDSVSSTPEWSEIKSLGFDAMFLGDNCSVSAPNFPGCESNYIYFTDDYIGLPRCCYPFGPRDMDIFNLRDKKHSDTLDSTSFPETHASPNLVCTTIPRKLVLEIVFIGLL